MKAINKALGLIAVSSLFACSNEEIMTPVIDAETNSPTEYPIQLSGGCTATTRAAITDDGSNEIKGIAVWGLAKDAMQENTSPQGIKWFSNNIENATCCIMKNVKANVISNSVEWDDPNARYYYPVTHFYRYEFYANYPYTTDVAYTETSAVANYTIDGTNDLLWGRATSDSPYAWSAKYFRVNGGQTLSNRPNIKLEHLLTRLVFYVQPGPKVEIPGATEDELDYEAASSMMVDTLQICNAYTNLAVKIADFNNLDMGISSRVTRRTGDTDTLYLKNAAGEIVSPIQVPQRPSMKAQWGESIMLFPSYEYVVRLVLHDSTGRKYVSEIPLTLSNLSTGFERGKSYNITITVHGPTSVTSAAKLVPWEELDGPELVL